MSRKTQLTKAELYKKIAAHTKWAKDQQTVVESLANYAKHAVVFIPGPTEPPEDQFDSKWKADKGVLVPFYCDGPVSIPPDHVMVSLAKDHNTHIPVCVAIDPNVPDARFRRYVTLSPDLELTLPWGRKAKLVMEAAGYTFKEDDPDTLPGPGAETKEEKTDG